MAVEPGIQFEIAPPYSQAAAALARIPDESAHQAADLLHPMAIWNRASLPVMRSLAHVAAYIQQVRQPDAAKPDMLNETWLQLLSWQERSLRALHQLIDLSYLVLVAASPHAAPRPKPETTNHHWLERHHPRVKASHWSVISPVSVDVGGLVNHVKHAGATLAPFMFRTRTESIPAYYFQGVGWKAGIGPDPACNPKTTCFSFNRDYRLRLLQFAWIDTAVSEAVKSIESETSASWTAFDPRSFASQSSWQSV